MYATEPSKNSPSLQLGGCKLLYITYLSLCQWCDASLVIPSPLQEVVSRPVVGSKGLSFDCSYDRSQSFQPSQSNVSSFSAYEDSQESSFVPFHDSWASRSKNASGAARPSFRRTEELQPQSLAPGDREPGLCYRAPLGAPVVPRTEENHTAVEQSFTQFDIRHPGLYEPASTPMVERVGRTETDAQPPAQVVAQYDTVFFFSRQTSPSMCQRFPAT